MTELIDKIPPFIWVVIVLVGYAAVVFYKVKGIPKTLLMIIIDVIENRAQKSSPEAAAILKELKVDIDTKVSKANLKADLNGFLAAVDDKHEVSKGTKVVRFLANIAKIAMMFK